MAVKLIASSALISVPSYLTKMFLQQRLVELGYAAFILRYRVWTDASDDAPLEDIGRAMPVSYTHLLLLGQDGAPRYGV